MESIPGGSYGGNYAGSAHDFDLIEFVKRPTSIARIVSIVFAIVVFGCISAGCYDSRHQYCIFNRNSDACHYGVAIGVLAFLACLLFLVVDVQFNGISNVGLRKQIVTADLGFSGVWSFLWFVGFCFLADQWRRSPIANVYQTNHARAAIAFSFFSVFSWVTLTLMAVQRYRQGDGFENNDQTSPYQAEFQGGYNGGGGPNFPQSQSPYASFPQPNETNPLPPTYQQQTPSNTEQPFGVPPQQKQPVVTEYNVPNY